MQRRPLVTRSIAWCALTQDNVRQHHQVARLGRLVEARLAAMQKIELHDRASPAAVAVMQTDRYTSSDDQIRSILTSMQAAEESLLSRRAAAAETAMETMIILSAVAATTPLLLMGFAYGLIGRELAHRQAREWRLQELAMTDPLTGLANRRALDEALKSTAVAGEPARLAMVRHPSRRGPFQELQ